jgi:hypothetical protein
MAADIPTALLASPNQVKHFQPPPTLPLLFSPLILGNCILPMSAAPVPVAASDPCTYLIFLVPL